MDSWLTVFLLCLIHTKLSEFTPVLLNLRSRKLLDNSLCCIIQTYADGVIVFVGWKSYDMCTLKFDQHWRERLTEGNTHDHQFKLLVGGFISLFCCCWFQICVFVGLMLIFFIYQICDWAHDKIPSLPAKSVLGSLDSGVVCWVSMDLRRMSLERENESYQNKYELGSVCLGLKAS